jgi:hypothetical protein
LAGLWVFLSLFELLQSYSPHELERFRKTAQNLCSKDVPIRMPSGRRTNSHSIEILVN